MEKLVLELEIRETHSLARSVLIANDTLESSLCTTARAMKASVCASSLEARNWCLKVLILISVTSVSAKSEGKEVGKDKWSDGRQKGCTRGFSSFY